MIDPRGTEDYWYRRKATLVGWTGSTFFGAGVPLKVILQGFAKSELVWFSVRFGTFDDNVLLLGLCESEARPLNKEQHIRRGPMAEAVGALYEEYNLNFEIMRTLGVTLDSERNTYSLDASKRVKYRVFVHDDCFFDVTGVDETIVRRLMHSILRMHSFYLKAEVDWSEVLDQLVRRVRESAAPLLLKSKPSHKCLIVRKEGLGNFLRSLLVPHSSCFASVQANKAKLIH